MGFAPGGVYMDYGLSRLYGLWCAFPCEPTWWTEKCMGFQGVWIIKAMDYEGSTVPITVIHEELSTENDALPKFHGEG